MTMRIKGSIIDFGATCGVVDCGTPTAARRAYAHFMRTPRRPGESFRTWLIRAAQGVSA